MSAFGENAEAVMLQNFHQLTEIDIKKLHHCFQQNVFNALLKQELITQDIVDNMLSWEHSGFNVWSGEPFSDPDSCSQETKKDDSPTP